MKTQIKNIFGRVLFECNKENNTIKDTVVEAIRQGVNLKHADLRNANLRNANLRNANLGGANLSYANLCDADLSDVNLNGADLYNANLSYANLSCADLINADLRDAYLSFAKNIPHIPFACPSEGSFIAWKKIFDYKEDYEGEFLVKLLIPEDAKRSSATSNKCRCSKALVLEITNIFTDENIDEITNISYRRCVYRVGEYVYPDYFDENRWKECSHGIHFFVDRQDAISY